MSPEASTIGGDQSLEELRRELAEAREQQAATSEILRVISSSPMDAVLVFAEIAASAARLCEASDAAIHRVDGEVLRLVVSQGSIPKGDDTLPLTREVVTGRAVLDGRTVQVADVQAETAEYPVGSANARRLGHRTLLAIPLMRAGEAIGVIGIRRTEIRPFTDRQIDLLKTFADQAVIAIENTRLFEEVQARQKELEARTKELHESLEYQTATSDVLDVISRSPTNVQPVFDAIAQSAARLFAPCIIGMLMREGDNVVLCASAGATNADYDALAKLFPLPFDPDTSIASQAMLTCQVVQITDIEAPDTLQAARAVGRAVGFRSVTAAPLLRNGKSVGAISVSSPQAGFQLSEKQIALLKTLADQAVIAIENARLFEAEQASKRELTEALEYQTATSKVLSVIGSSPGDLAPVFDAMLTNAVRICEATFGVLFRYDGNVFQPAATLGVPPAYAEFLQERGSFRPTPGVPMDRLVNTEELVHITDDAAEQYPGPAGKYGGARSLIAVPMRKEKELVGAFIIYRTEVRPFTDKQIDLVKGFANQAVIAIENVRLLNELRESLQQQTATADVLKVISRSPTDIQPVLDAVAKSAAALCEAGAVAVFRRDGNQLRLVANHRPLGHVIVGEFSIPLIRGTANGRSVLEGRTIHIADIQSEVREYPEGSETGRKLGHRTILAVPLVREGIVIGSIGLRRASAQLFTDAQVALVETFADQAVIAIENTRLFQEVQARTRELAKTIEDLEIASQHKNQFVANMSHELRTPLAAILGYAELMQEGFYDPLGQKSLDALTRIRSNGKHLLSLINTVLDIAKIESGQFTLNMSEYAIETVVETVRAATESLAQNKRLALTTSVDKPLPIGLGDEQRLTQVLLNLVGNAIKFTDAGVVSIAAGARNGNFAVSVTDTGPGIPLDQQDRIFDQFHQVDSSITKAKGGTGLGLTIAKQIVEMHGGRIWVESAPGKGSTFQMELPTRAQFDKKTP